MRRLALLMTGLVLWPAAGAAQVGETRVDNRFALTAYTGARVPFTTGHANVFTQEGDILFSVREERGGNAILGLEGEVRVWGPLSLVAGGAYSRAGQGEFYLNRDPQWGERGDFAVRYTSDTWLAKAGVTARLTGPTGLEAGRRRLTTDFTLASALVRQFEANHPAINLGFRGSMPVRGSPIEFTLGIEDYFVFWDQDAVAPAVVDVMQMFDPEAAEATLLYSTSNLLVLRIGASWRH